MNWNLCLVCQKQTDEPTKCPVNSLKKEHASEAYEAFLGHLRAFRDIDSIPVDVNLGSHENAESLRKHYACWHKSCHSKFNNRELERARKRANSSSEPIKSREKDVRTKRHKPNQERCIFCNEEHNLHQFSTFEVDKNVRAMAEALQHQSLLARIQGGDLIAIEAKYHLPCLTRLRNQYRLHQGRKQDLHDTKEMVNESRAYVELTSYINKSVEGGTLMFKLADLHHIYTERLQDLNIEKQINKTRLKVKLLQSFPEAQDQFDGRNTVLVFQDGMRGMLREALKDRDFDEDAKVLAKAAQIVREDIFKHEGFQFKGSFPEGCQEDSVPPTLKHLIAMILNGSNITNQSRQESQACLTISQALFFNSKKRSSTTDAYTRHSLLRETPLQVYTGLKLHTLTRSKTMLQFLHQMGLSISYDRVMAIEDSLASAACKQYEEEGVVCPSALSKGLFTVAALDNLDHNPSSTTAQSSFHGTGISLFQFPTAEDAGEPRHITRHLQTETNTQQHLPDFYTSVPAVALNKNNVAVPECGEIEQHQNTLPQALAEEDLWTEAVMDLLEKEELSKDDAISWAAYHASTQEPLPDPPAVGAMLPLFHEKSATPSMIKHGMEVSKQAITFLNPGQVPVITCDQPLFALAKYVQWCWPQTHGEEGYVVMLGGLHIEMALWNVMGDLLECTGWTTALVDAGVASFGVVDSFLRVSHLMRTRYASFIICIHICYVVLSEVHVTM